MRETRRWAGLGQQRQCMTDIHALPVGSGVRRGVMALFSQAARSPGASRRPGVKPTRQGRLHQATPGPDSEQRLGQTVGKAVGRAGMRAQALGEASEAMICS